MAVAAPVPDQRAERIALAMEMLNLGFRLFPLYPRSKNPMTKAGFKDATDDPKKVATFLNHAGITGYGMVAPENVIEWDIDGPDWRQSMEEMTGKWGKPGSTLRTKSPHGFHLFYEVDPEVMALPGSKMLGFVCRKTGEHGKGYVVGPGSVVDDPETGETDLMYTREGPLTIAKLAPAWQHAALAEQKQHLKPVGAPLITVSEAGGYVAPTSVAPGGRYEAIRTYTAHLYNAGNTTEEMWALVQTVLAPTFTEQYAGNGLRDSFDRAIKGMEQALGTPAHALKAAHPAKLTIEERQQKASAKGAYRAEAFTTYALREMDWLWDEWLARKSVTLLDGNPGTGKSNIMIDLIARMSRGDDWPDGTKGTGRPQRSLYITTEDAPDTTLGPRLLAAGGDPAYVFFLEAEFIVPDDEHRLAALISEMDLALVVIDPIMSHLGADVKVISDSDVRTNVMNPLTRVAEGGNVAIVALRHFSKNTQASAINRGAGSLGGFTGKAREVWAVVPNPDDEEGSQRIFGIAKNNYGRDDLALKYHIEGVTLPGWKRSVSHVVWDGRSSVSVDEIMSDLTPERTEGAITKLRGILAGGPLPATDVVAAMERGTPKVSRAKTYRIAKRMGVVMEMSGFPAKSIWRSPDMVLNVPVVPRAHARTQEARTPETAETAGDSVSDRMAAIFSTEESQVSQVSQVYSSDIYPDENETAAFWNEEDQP